MKYRIVIVLIGAFLGSFLKAEDVLYLRSGEVIQGTITGQDAAQQCLYFRFPDGREYRIRNSDIQQLGNSAYLNRGPSPIYSNAAPQWGMPPQGNTGMFSAPPMNSMGGPAPMGDRSLSSMSRQTQETAPGKNGFWDSVRWGVRAGINSANVKLSDATKASSVTGGSAAVLAEVPVWGRLSLQGELGYSQYGFSGTLSGESVKLNYDAVEAQLLGKFRVFNMRRSTNVSLLGGVAPAYRASAKVTSGSLGLQANTYSKRATASGVVGATFTVKVGKTTELGLDVRQLFGLTNMSANDVAAKNATTFVGASLIF